jgi:hypothetical protein
VSSYIIPPSGTDYIPTAWCERHPNVAIAWTINTGWFHAGLGVPCLACWENPHRFEGGQDED